MLTDGFERLVEDLSDNTVEDHDSDDMENNDEYGGVKLESLIDKDDSQLLPKMSGKVNNRAMKKKIAKLKKAKVLTSNVDHYVDEISTKITDTVVVKSDSPTDLFLQYNDNSDNGKMQLVEEESTINSNNEKVGMAKIESNDPKESGPFCVSSNPFDEEPTAIVAINPFSDEFVDGELDKDISKVNNKNSQLNPNNISEKQRITSNKSITIENVTCTKIISVEPSVEQSEKISSNPFDNTHDDDISTSPTLKQSVMPSSLSKNQKLSSENNAEHALLSTPNKKGENIIEKSIISSSITTTSNSNKNGEIMMKLKKLGFSEKFVIKALQLNKNDFVLTLGWLRDEISGRERANAASNSTGTVWRPPLITRISSWMPNISAANTLIPNESDKPNASSNNNNNNSSTEGSCIGYYITVLCNDIDNLTQSVSSPSWKVVRRYSQFYDLHCKLAHHISTEFPGGSMLTPFTDDRLRVWWYGTTDDICRQRQEKLDQWMREILTSPMMMTNPDVYDMLSEFLEVKIHTSKRTLVIPTSQVVPLNRRVLPISPTTATTATSSISTAVSASSMPPPPPLPIKPTKSYRINDSTRNSDISGGSEPYGDYYQSGGGPPPPASTDTRSRKVSS